jgi:hypothetical protein
MSSYSFGVEQIGLERTRQIEIEGYTPEWDSSLPAEHLVGIAERFINQQSDSPLARTASLVKAGACIAAEIDRINIELIEQEHDQFQALLGELDS